MPNYQGSPSNLRKEPPKWKHLPTKAIRVPEVFADRLLETARKLDDTEYTLNKADITPGLGIPDTECTLKAVDILTQSLKLKPNNGSAIKAEIRKALNLLRNKEVPKLDPGESLDTSDLPVKPLELKPYCHYQTGMQIMYQDRMGIITGVEGGVEDFRLTISFDDGTTKQTSLALPILIGGKGYRLLQYPVEGVKKGDAIFKGGKRIGLVSRVHNRDDTCGADIAVSFSNKKRQVVKNLMSDGYAFGYLH